MTIRNIADQKHPILCAPLFGCDDVLADTEPNAHRTAFNLAFKERGFRTVWDEGQYVNLLNTGGGKERIFAYWNTVGWPIGYDDQYERDTLVKSIHSKKTEVFVELVKCGKLSLRSS